MRRNVSAAASCLSFVWYVYVYVLEGAAAAEAEKGAGRLYALRRWFLYVDELRPHEAGMFLDNPAENEFFGDGMWNKDGSAFRKSNTLTVGRRVFQP